MVRVITGQVQTGDRKYELDALEIGGTHAKVEFTLSAGPKDRILEIRELHKREDAGFAYQVCVNGTPVYFRTGEPIADAPVSVFIMIPEELSPVEGAFRIGIESFHEDLFRLVSLQLHPSDILHGAGKHPMKLGFFSPSICLNDMDKDIATVEKLRDNLGNPSMFRIMIGFDIFYMSRTDEELENILSYLLCIAEKKGIDLYLDYNTWWSGTPSGPDGKGGYFADVEYNQVIYDPQSQRYSLSVPNMWSNTPWYTMNHETLNHARKTRVKKAIDILQRLEARLYHNRQDAPKISLFIDNEPTYWANFAYSDSPDSGGDFSLAAVEAAGRDGVCLRPEKDITKEQRLWLLKNLNDYISDLSKTMKNASEKEYGVVREGKTTYSGRDLAENIYTHIFPNHSYPFVHFKYPQWETHVTKWAKLGLEGCLWEDPRIMEYAIQFGKLAMINAERCCYSDQTFLHMYYMYGAEAGMIFNYYPGDPAEISAVGDQGGKKYAEADYAYPVYEYDVFFKELQDPSIMETRNLALRPYRQRKVLQPDTPGTGSILLKTGKAGQYPYGARLELSAFVKPSNGGIRVCFGNAPDKLDWVKDLEQHDNPNLPLFVDLPVSTFQAEDDLFLRLEITSRTFDEDWAQLNYIWFIRLLAPHAFSAGHSNGYQFTCDEKRELSRMVIYREECRKLCEDHPWLVDALPDEIRNTNSFIEKYNGMLQLLSIRNTFRFLIENEGGIGEFPLYAHVTAPVFVDIKPKEGGYLIHADGSAGSVLEISGRDGIQSEPAGINTWFIRAGNEKSISLILEKGISPAGITGRFDGWADTGIYIQTQDTTVSGYQHKIKVPVKRDVRIQIRDAGGEKYRDAVSGDIKGGERIEAVLEDGVATQIRLTGGRCTGEITTVIPMDFVDAAHNPIISIRIPDGSVRSFEAGRDCALRYGKPDKGDVLSMGRSDLGLTCGKKVCVTYSPYCTNGRLPRALIIEEVPGGGD